MGRLHYKESSFENAEEGDEKEKEEEEHVVPAKKARTPVLSEQKEEEEIKFGEQLQDDLINSFCDKLQSVCPYKIEALFAIQYLLITDVADLRKQVTGKNPAIQVLYDRTRSHYVLAYYNVEHKHLEFFDSLQQFSSDGTPKMVTEICVQMNNLFGHLYTKNVPYLIDREFELQADNFSCGYRVVGALVDIARRNNPAHFRYSRNAILEFLRQILNEPKPTWKMFETARIGKPKQYSGNNRVKFYLSNLTYTATTSSSRSSSLDSNASESSKTSRNSNVSQNSEDSRVQSSQLSATIDRRARAGYTMYEKELMRKRMMTRIPFTADTNEASNYLSAEISSETLTAEKVEFQPPDGSILGYLKAQYHHYIGGIWKRIKDDDGDAVDHVENEEVKE